MFSNQEGRDWGCGGPRGREQDVHDAEHLFGVVKGGSRAKRAETGCSWHQTFI